MHNSCFPVYSEKSPSSGSEGAKLSKRSRQSSFSIVYEGGEDSASYPWFFKVQLPYSSSEDEVYSVQVSHLKSLFHIKKVLSLSWFMGMMPMGMRRGYHITDILGFTA